MDNSPFLISHSDEDSPAYSDDGVDLTLIRWMLTITPSTHPMLYSPSLPEMLILLAV